MANGENDVRIDITADSSGVKVGTSEAKASLAALGDAFKMPGAALEASTNKSEAFLASLKRQVDTFGMTRGQIVGYDAELKGLTGAHLESAKALGQQLDALDANEQSMKRIKIAAAAMGAAIGAAAVVIGKQMLAEVMEAEQSGARLEAVYKTVGEHLNLTLTQIRAQRDALAKGTLFDDNEIEDAQAKLMTFKSITGAAFGQTMQMAADLAAVMKTDLNSAVIQLGKALEDPERGLTALRRSGVSFSEEQRDMIKGMVEAGNQAAAMTEILKIMREQGFDGAAQAMKTGITKEVDDLGKAWRNMLQAIGETDAIKGAVEGLLSAMTGIAEWVGAHPDLAKWLILGTVGIAAGSVALIGLGALATAVTTLGSALTGLAAFLAANPLVLSIMGLTAAGVAGFKFGTFLAEQIDIAVKAVSGDKFATLGTAIYDMVQWFKALPGKIKDAIKGWYAEFKGVGSNIMQGLMDGITAKYDQIVKKIKNLGTDMLDSVKDVLGIRSPSKEMELVGENTVLGMLLGMENEAPGLYATATEIGENTMAAFEKPFRDNKGRFLPADEADRTAAVWSRASQDISNSLTDALLRGFEDGADFASNFVDTLKNMFSSLVLRPIIQPIAQAGSSAVLGALGMGASGSASAGDLLGAGSSLMGLMAPGAISTQIGLYAGGMAEMAGATSALAGSIGTAVATVIPWVGAIAALGSMFGLFGGKPSNKAAFGSVDLATGSTFGLGNQTGKKQASQQTMDTRTALLSGIGGYSSILGRLGGTSAYKSIGVDVGERDGVQFSFDGGKLQGYGNDPSTALVKLFHELALGAEGLSDPLRTLLGYFEGTADEMATFANGLLVMTEYLQANPMQAAADAATEAGRSAWQTWVDQGATLRTALTAWDGSAQKSAELAELTQSRYQTELSLAMQIQSALESTHAMFASTIEEMKYSVLDQEGKYNFLRDQSAALEDALKAALDPSEIENLSKELNDVSRSAWQLLGEEERKVKLAEYETYLNEIDALTTERLNAAGATITAEHETSLSDSIAAAIDSAMQRVADQMMAAAQAQQKAADTPLRVTVEVDQPADVEVSYG